MISHNILQFPPAKLLHIRLPTTGCECENHGQAGRALLWPYRSVSICARLLAKPAEADVTKAMTRLQSKLLSHLVWFSSLLCIVLESSTYTVLESTAAKAMTHGGRYATQRYTLKWSMENTTTHVYVKMDGFFFSKPWATERTWVTEIYAQIADAHKTCRPWTMPWRGARKFFRKRTLHKINPIICLLLCATMSVRFWALWHYACLPDGYSGKHLAAAMIPGSIPR